MEPLNITATPVRRTFFLPTTSAIFPLSTFPINPPAKIIDTPVAATCREFSSIINKKTCPVIAKIE